MASDSQEYLLSEFTSTEVAELIASGTIKRILFPHGSIEQHGAHLPLKMDAFFGYRIARDMALELGNTIVAPAMNYGSAKHHLGFAGTISLSTETLTKVIEEQIDSAVKSGFTEILFVTGHGGNYGAMGQGIANWTRENVSLIEDKGIKIVSDAAEKLLIMAMDKFELDIPQNIMGQHAGELETSILMALGEDVRLDKLQTGYIGVLDEEMIGKLLKNGMKEISPNGVLGDATQADRSRGEKYYQLFLKEFSAYFSKELGLKTQ